MPDLDYDAYAVPEPPDDLTDSIMSAVAEAPRLQPSVDKHNPQLRLVLIGGAVVAAAAIAVLVWTLRGGGDDDDRRATTGDRVHRSVATDRTRPPARERRTSKTVDERSEPISPRLRRFKSTEARQELERDIGRAAAKREQRAAGGSGSSHGGGGQDFVLTKEDIQGAMQEIRPLIVECYEMALETTPDLAGKLTVAFTIVGEPDIGTIVSEAELESDDGMTDDADFSECVEQTILSLELPAPEAGGGEIFVRYPFIFRSSDEPTHTVPASSDDNKARLHEARDAAKSGQWGKAMRLCQEVLDDEPDNTDAVMVCALAACNLKNQKLAQKYVGQLTGARQQMARQICVRNGVELD